jgi:hypothetical protein
MGYSAQIPRCIGTFDDDLHAAAWDFYAVKDEPIQIGLVNLYMLLSFDNLLSTEDALKNLDLRLKTILIYNNQIKNPEFEAWRTIDRVIEMDNLLATHAGEISTDEKAFLDSSAGAEAEKDPQYELILKKQK